VVSRIEWTPSCTSSSGLADRVDFADRVDSIEWTSPSGLADRVDFADRVDSIEWTSSSGLADRVDFELRGSSGLRRVDTAWIEEPAGIEEMPAWVESTPSIELPPPTAPSPIGLGLMAHTGADRAQRSFVYICERACSALEGE
jgi:hypothetical protein